VDNRARLSGRDLTERPAYVVATVTSLLVRTKIGTCTTRAGETRRPG
jgi:hypothetical protein